jgi:hypothetical protein
MDQAYTYLPRSAFDRRPLNFRSLSCFLNFNGSFIFIRDQELVFIDIFLGWLVFSLVQSWSVFLSLEIDLFYVMLVLVLFIGVPPIYDTFCSVVPLLSVSVRLVQT